MEGSIYILIVGHDLQAKCNVANAFIKQRNVFKQFSCRQNLLVRKVGDTTGRTFFIVLTPNLNTPAWTDISNGIIRFNRKVFVYVKSPSHIRVNDNKSIETLRNMFRESRFQILTYFQNQKDAELAKTDNIYIHENMPFKERIETVKNLLPVAGKSFQRNFVKSVDVGGEPSVSERQDTEDLHLQQDIQENEWDLMNKTLRYGRAKSNHVRVNIVGNQGAGKTTLLLRLHNLDVKCPDDQQKPTEALEIKELTSRCIEEGDEKHWETNKNGYIDDLNVQRMAQAMKYAKRNLGENKNMDDISTDNIEETIDVERDVSSGSYFNHEMKSDKQDPDSTKSSREQPRELYMKQILRKKNHSRGERMYISYWDFAGQSTYYSTHQVFMSPSAVYVLVVDLSVDLNEKLSDNLNFRTGIIKDCSVAESLMFWISSIKAFTSDIKGGNAPVLIVGTHIDEVKKNSVKDKRNPENLEEVISKKFDEIREVLKMSEVECIAIDNAEPDISDLVALRNRILELGLGVIDEEIPAQWIDLERRIQEQKLKGTVFMTFNDLKGLDEGMDVPILDNTRLEAFLGHQHNRGHLIHFLHANFKDLIILEPDVLAKFLNNLMRRRDNEVQRGMKKCTSMYNHNGIINQNYVIEIAKKMTDYPAIKANVDNLLNMLVHLSVIRPYNFQNNDTRYLLPCLLPDKPKGNIRKDSKETKSFQVVFPNNHMPPTFYHILVGGLLNEWKPIEKAIDKPEIYNLYACFRLDKETHQMEIFWEESCVYIDILNYSETTVLTTDQFFEILNIVEKRIVEVFVVYRHTNTNYEMRVLCPRHKKSFVSLSTLKKDGEAMCYHGSDRHGVGFKQIFRQKVITEKIPDCYSRKPADKDLGRLARYLARENATSLATRLRIHQALVEADRAAQTFSDESSRRLSILFCWRRSNGSETIGNLLNLLMLTGEYHRGDFENLFEGIPNKDNYGKAIPDEKLDIIPDNKCDIIAASDSIGVSYPFLMLELGLDYKDVEFARANDPQDIRAIIMTLLLQWRQQHPRKCTTRTLLDTAKFVGIDTTEIQERIMRS